MPELPDLLHVVAVLRGRLLGRAVEVVRVDDPLVLRCAVPGDLTLLQGQTLGDLARVAQFLVFSFGGYDLAVNPMLAGRFKLSAPGARREGSACFGLVFGDVELRYLDDKRMGKAWLTLPGGWRKQPGL